MVLDLKNTIFYWIEELFLKGLKDSSVYSLEVISESNQFRINISGEDVSILTDNKNEYLLALQHLVRTLSHLDFPEDRTHFLLDANFIRRDKEEKLKMALPSVIDKEVIDNGNSIIITGLNGYERLLVRRCLEGVKNIDMMSVGSRKDRKLLVTPSSNIGTKGLDNSIVFDTGLMKLIKTS